MSRVSFAFAFSLVLHVGLMGVAPSVRVTPRPVSPETIPVVVQRFPSPGNPRAARHSGSAPTERSRPSSADGDPIPPARGESAGPIAGSRGVIGLSDVLAWGNEPPEYPVEALERGWEGTVELQVRWDATGEAGDVRILRSSGHRVLDTSARTAALDWKAPLHFAGRRIRVPVAYRLDGS